MGPKKCLTNQRVCKNWDTKSIVINLVFNFYFSHVCVLSVSNACLDFSFWRNWKFMYHFLCFSSSSSSAPPPLRDFVICILSLHFWHISPSSYPLYLAKIVGSHFRIFWSRALILKPRMTMVQIQKILRRFFRVLYNPCRTWKLMKIVRVKRELKISFEIVIFRLFLPYDELQTNADKVTTASNTWRLELSKIDIWYATFGSNMWKPRFLCYIEGGQVWYNTPPKKNAWF